MADHIIVTVQGEDVFAPVVVQEDQLVFTSTSLNNPTTVSNLSDIGDVDVSSQGKVDGSVLVYKTATSKWTSTLLLNQQVMDAGEF